MIKKILLALAVALPMCAWAQSAKFGIVDVETIIPNMPEFVEAQNKLAEASKTYEAEYAKINEEMQKLYAELQELDKDPNTLQSIKERRMQDIQDRDKKAQQFAQTAQQDLQRQQAQLMQPVQEKVMNAIKSVGTENGFTMIFPEAVPAFISADVQDVTALVKAKLGIKE
ncbi:MAG: OmpH family outer membrane protein [Muribaculaceae bacterium]|nr:OmpH family outer membrane protein [Muribaculaceae bacterium]